MRKLRKKNFILLELLIAFALVSITILPFIRFPYAQMRKEIDLLFEMQLEKVAQEELADLQVEIFQKKVDSKLFFSKKAQRDKPYQEEEITLSLFSKRKRKYIKQVFLYWERQKKDSDNKTYAFCTIKIKYFYPKNLKSAALIAKTQFIAEKKPS